MPPGSSRTPAKHELLAKIERLERELKDARKAVGAKIAGKAAKKLQAELDKERAWRRRLENELKAERARNVRTADLGLDREGIQVSA